ncbi:MAG: Anucleate primary sterigmata protein B [Bogoriella megaspora]|nr:MAG: Anucleate primary sterigmata protein B [Bogoriella megaspora]
MASPDNASSIAHAEELLQSQSPETVVPTYEQEDEPRNEPSLSNSENDDIRIFEQSDSELPPLPVDESSYVSGIEDSMQGPGVASERQNDPMGSTMIDEREMNRHLMDVESSFLPEASPVPQTHGEKGIDDTYIFGGRDEAQTSMDSRQEQDKGPRRSADAPPTFQEKANPPATATPSSPPTPKGAYKTPGQGLSGAASRSTGAEESAEDTSELGPLPSSPAAAAADRTHNKPAVETRYKETTSRAEQDTITDVLPSNVGVEGSDEMPIEERQASSPSERTERPVTQDSERDTLAPLNGSANGNSLSSRLLKRPSYLKTRQSSQRSSTSSFTNTSDGDRLQDSTLSTDYALQTGGAISADSSINTRGSMGLSRLPSLGSVASSAFSDATPTYDRHGSFTSNPFFPNLGSTRSRDNFEEDLTQSNSAPTTPRAGSPHDNVPTDTVIAQHVRNIQVPDTIAHAFRARHRSQSPDKRPVSSGMTSTLASRNRSHLTLKEQNGKIDKLSKENFDLKLKIHFLDQALQNRSDEGIKEMISKNVQHQTDLANEKKDNQSLRRRIRELERKVKSQEDGLAEARRQSTESNDEINGQPNQEADMEEEILYLREQLEYSEVQVEKLTEEKMSKEVENRRLAEYVRNMGERKSSEPSAGDEETVDMWKDLLQAETARREQADEDAQKYRDEIAQLKSQLSAQSAAQNSRQTSKFSRRFNQLSYTVSNSGDSETASQINGATHTSASSTLVDQLKHENAELRRDLGAQTSMLTSRNRERERLQQEIEDLKLAQRRGEGAKSIAGDSIFERSVSRQQQRPASRASGHTRTSHLSDAEREEYDRKQAALRDELAEAKILNQDLERELNAHLDELAQTEDKIHNLEEEMQSATEDLQALQTERDEALVALQDKEQECDELEKEAISTIDQLEEDLQQKQTSLEKIESDLANRNEDFQALQRELKKMSESVIHLEDDRVASSRRIEVLERELDDANRELETQDKRLREMREKNERLEIATESHQDEISFLREEQEGDKIRIGELEDALNAAQQAVADEKERLRDLEQRMKEERAQREALDSQEKEQVQKVMDELNGQTSKAKEEVRKLRKNLSAKEVEAAGYKERLDELEGGLRNAFDDASGAGHGLLKHVAKLQKDLIVTVETLETHRHNLAEKERLLRSRDALLESTGLESRKLSDLLDAERSARRRERLIYENSARGHQAHRTTLAAHEARVLELETQKGVDKRKIATLEERFREQLLERHNLLLALWNRLSTLCGADWVKDHALVDGQNPSLEVISRNLHGFSKNLVLAMKTVEGLVGTFKQRARQMEKDLWRDFQTLEHTLDVRTKRLENVETWVKDVTASKTSTRPTPPSRRSSLGSTVMAGGSSSSRHTEELSRLSRENKILKAELKFARENAPPAFQQAQQRPSSSMSTSSNTGAGAASGSRDVAAHAARASVANSLLRHHSTSAVEMLQAAQRDGATDSPHPGSPHHGSTGFPHVVSSSHRDSHGRTRSVMLHSPPIQPSEQRWIHRLKELERRLKAEREARLLDRSGARKRLEEGRAENEELRMLLEREKVRRGSVEVGGGVLEEEVEK